MTGTTSIVRFRVASEFRSLRLGMLKNTTVSGLNLMMTSASMRVRFVVFYSY